MLRRVAPGAAALGRSGSTRLAAEEGRTRGPSGELAVVPYVAGSDLGAIAEAAGPISRGAALALAREVLLALRDARPVGHGRLDAGAVRVGPGGRVVVVGFAGGDGSDDLAALADLLSELGAGEIELGADLDAAVEAVADADPGELLAWVPPMVPSTGVLPHELAGAAWTDAAPPPESAPVPPRVRVARTAALTLLLGAAIGGVLAGAGSGGVARVTVEGAETVGLRCAAADLRVTGSEALLPVDAGRCEVSARLASGVVSVGALDVRRPGRYACRAPEGVLRCSEP